MNLTLDAVIDKIMVPKVIPMTLFGNYGYNGYYSPNSILIITAICKHPLNNLRVSSTAVASMSIV